MQEIYTIYSLYHKQNLFRGDEMPFYRSSFYHKEKKSKMAQTFFYIYDPSQILTKVLHYQSENRICGDIFMDMPKIPKSNLLNIMKKMMKSGITL